MPPELTVISVVIRSNPKLSISIFTSISTVIRFRISINVCLCGNSLRSASLGRDGQLERMEGINRLQPRGRWADTGVMGDGHTGDEAQHVAEPLGGDEGLDTAAVQGPQAEMDGPRGEAPFCAASTGLGFSLSNVIDTPKRQYRPCCLFLSFLVICWRVPGGQFNWGELICFGSFPSAIFSPRFWTILCALNFQKSFPQINKPKIIPKINQK